MQQRLPFFETSARSRRDPVTEAPPSATAPPAKPPCQPASARAGVPTPPATPAPKPAVAERELSQNGATESRGGSPAPAAVLAERYKTRLCRNYAATGLCAYKTRCMFAHGAHELRTTEANLRDGLVSEAAIKAFQHQQAASARAREREAWAGARRTPPPPVEAQRRPPSFEEAMQHVGARWRPAYAAEGPAVGAWESHPGGQRCYRHNPYLPAILNVEDRLWSTPLTMEHVEEGPGGNPEFGPQIPHDDEMLYEAPFEGNGYFPAEVYGEVEPLAEVSRPPMKSGCSFVNMDEEDELCSNAGMILEP